MAPDWIVFYEDGGEPRHTTVKAFNVGEAYHQAVRAIEGDIYIKITGILMETLYHKILFTMP
jgi:hypothetical protein